MKATPQRIKAILAELEKSSAEYVQTKETLGGARTQFEAAREKFSGVRRLAGEMMTSMDWHAWKDEHPAVQYAGISTTGDAILQALRDRAFDSAYSFIAGKIPEFSPEMTIERLLETLESGGFEFQSITPLRELNAALINLKGITKTDYQYRIEDADDILASGVEHFGPA